MSKKTKQIAIRIDPELFKKLETEAARRGETVTNYVRSSAVMRLSGDLVPVRRNGNGNGD